MAIISKGPSVTAFRATKHSKKFFSFNETEPTFILDFRNPRLSHRCAPRTKPWHDGSAKKMCTSVGLGSRLQVSLLQNRLVFCIRTQHTLTHEHQLSNRQAIDTRDGGKKNLPEVGKRWGWGYSVRRTKQSPEERVYLGGGRWTGF